MPVTWITPKTDWLPTDGFTADDYNRIENNRAYISNAVYHVSTEPVTLNDGDVVDVVMFNRISIDLDRSFAEVGCSWNRGFVARRTPYGSAWNHNDLNVIETFMLDFKRYLDGELDNKATIYAGGEIYCGDNISVGLL